MTFVCYRCGFKTISVPGYKSHIATCHRKEESRGNSLVTSASKNPQDTSANNRYEPVQSSNNLSMGNPQSQYNKPIYVLDTDPNTKGYIRDNLNPSSALHLTSNNNSNPSSPFPLAQHMGGKTTTSISTTNKHLTQHDTQLRRESSPISNNSYVDDNISDRFSPVPINISHYLNTWTCNLCSVVCNSKEKYAEHLKGAKHQKKQKQLYDETNVYAFANNSEITSHTESLQDVTTALDALSLDVPKTITGTTSGVAISSSDTKGVDQPQLIYNLDKLDIPMTSLTNLPSIDELMRSSTRSSSNSLFGEDRNKQYYKQSRIGPLEVYSCTLCNVDCNGLDVLKIHFNGKQHLKNLNRSMAADTYFVDENKLPSYSGSEGQIHYRDTNNIARTNDVDEHSANIPYLFANNLIERVVIGNQQGFTCKTCNLYCNSLDGIVDHVSGRKHKKEFAAYVARQLLATPPVEVKSAMQLRASSSSGQFDKNRATQILEYYWAQTFGAGAKPVYNESSVGPPHNSTFTCTITLAHIGNQVVTGRGSTRKDAKKDACINACTILDNLGMLKPTVPGYLYMSN